MNLPIIVQQELNASVAEVWLAITEREQMIQWFFEDIPSFEVALGFETQFPVISEGRTFTHQWKVLESAPGQMYRLDWSYKEYDGRGEVTFELEEDGDGTLLVITNTGLETFPSEIPEFNRESCEGGWRYFAGRLAVFLDA